MSQTTSRKIVCERVQLFFLYITFSSGPILSGGLKPRTVLGPFWAIFYALPNRLYVAETSRKHFAKRYILVSMSCRYVAINSLFFV